MIDISNQDKAEVLAALYNHSKPQGLGMMHFDPSEMTTAEAKELLGMAPLNIHHSARLPPWAVLPGLPVPGAGSSTHRRGVPPGERLTPPVADFPAGPT